MKTIIINKNNMMSVLMGTGVDQTWRSQPDVAIKVPFEEWWEYIQENQNLLTQRSPFNVCKYLKEKPKTNWYKIFLWDICHAQWNELIISSNKSCDCTLIVPTYEGENSKSVFECIDLARGLSTEELNSARSLLQAQKPAPPIVLEETMSNWNYGVLLYVIYLQHFAYTSKGKESRIKIDIRR